MAVQSNASTPWSWTPSSFWDGNDGLWNSFIVQVGTPPQDFRVLPSILEQAVWVLHPQGCTPDDPTDCPYSRGALPFNGANSTGLQVNESSTWDPIGIYTLSSYGESMGSPGNGLFGFDTVALSNNSHALELSEQVVAAIADKSFYLGQFGLGPKPSNFSTFNEPIANYMATLVNQSRIPSLSFGYTAGAHYRDKASASLTLGGYDENRYEPSEISFTMDADNARPLQVGVQKILAENSLRDSINLLPTGTFHLVDSTVPHIWMPDDAIDEFVTAFGLRYDNTTELYLVNDTIHEELLQRQPTITFVLGNSSTEGMGSTQNIELPYAAFDLQAGSPFYENERRNYFPIRRAANSTQYTIGRTFLQEAYVIIDWERQNFTVAQARFDSLDEESIVPILSKADDEDSKEADPGDGTASQDDGLGAGAIAGIVIGSVAFVALVGLAVFLSLRKRKARSAAIVAGDRKPDASSMHKSPYQQSESELESSNVNEMPSNHAVVEAEGVPKWGRFSSQEAPTAPVGQMHGRSELGHGDSFRPEAPGDERHWHELPADVITFVSSLINNHLVKSSTTKPCGNYAIVTDMQPITRTVRVIRPGFFRRPFSTTTAFQSSWSPQPAPPRLPKEEQEIFEKLQEQSTGAFSTPRTPSSATDTAPPTQNPVADENGKVTEPVRSEAANDMLAQLKERARVSAQGDGEELHPNVRRGAKPEFEGDVNPKTGEVGGPKNNPLRWGETSDWSYNGRVTDF